MVVCLFQQESIAGAQFTALWPIRNDVDLTSSESEEEDVKPSFKQYHDAMKSFQDIKWLRDLVRKESQEQQPFAGRGVFAPRGFAEEDLCVARYSGNLVDDSGNLMISCPATANLFVLHPVLASRPHSASHCAKIKGRRSNLMVDGSHHAHSQFDSMPNRNGLDWGSCINSSISSAKANCKIIW